MNFFPDSYTINAKVDSYILNAFFITGLDQIPLDALAKIIILEANKDGFIIRYQKDQNSKPKVRNINYYIKKKYKSFSRYIISDHPNYKIIKDKLPYLIEIANK